MSSNIVFLTLVTLCFAPLLFHLVLSNPVLIPGAEDKEAAGRSQVFIQPPLIPGTNSICQSEM
jgi:hypothetical protein